MTPEPLLVVTSRLVNSLPHQPPLGEEPLGPVLCRVWIYPYSLKNSSNIIKVSISRIVEKVDMLLQQCVQYLFVWCSIFCFLCLLKSSRKLSFRIWCCSMWMVSCTHLQSCEKHFNVQTCLSHYYQVSKPINLGTTQWIMKITEQRISIIRNFHKQEDSSNVNIPVMC